MESASTILIVDDELGGRKTLEALLKAEGYRMAFAAGGAEALEKAGQVMPDLILLDVMMPGMDGFEVCRRLRADEVLAEIPVIMVTALDDRDSRLQGIESGADDFVSKPFDRAELRARVRTTTRLNRYRRLLAERTKFEWAVDQAAEGYVILSETGHIVYANPFALRYLSLAEGVVAAKTQSFVQLAASQYQCQPQEAWQAWQTGPCASSGPLYLVRTDAPAVNALWLQVEALALPAGREGGWLVRLRDVTAQMTLQCDSWSFQVMVGHKMRTPLTSIIGSLELVARHAPRLSVDEIVEFIQVALRNVKRLHNDVEEILQYANVSGVAGRDGETHLAGFESLVKLLGDELGLTGITVSVQAGLETGELKLSPQAVELILWEILENSKKFHPQQSPQMEVALARRSVDALDSSVCLRVCDDGLNVPPELLPRVWSPYYQAEKSFTGEVKGMGLGLPMVAILVWSAGGECRIRNREDRPGVVVELDLPFAPGQPLT